ncbi:alpha/beta fold hydrolase [Paenibacillus mendelii]|uniref:Alpha/beta fold hydrolase n=1 Tax=Paenibacillus mendelii TaxID=206163 RepID=A0ABV6JCS8_9BACL|nr:alpha/beta hydrolase [Paenibacillus mendelii]MCQ6558626.1 alpha/beta hydrolase [Paenibacillus mendelii]
MPKVTCNGITMHYQERGSGAPLVLLMGLGADASLWEEHVCAYEDRYRCLLVDNRGAGDTDKPAGPYTTAEMARDTLGLLDALGIEQAHVSGISMGSAIAQELALLAPERVKSLTLNCPWAACDIYTTRIFETFRCSYELLSRPDFQKLLQLFIFTPAYHERHLPDLLARQQGAVESGNPMPVHAFQAQCDACITHDTVRRLGGVTAPTFITVGDRDIFTPLQLSQTITELMPCAELVVFEGSGHTHHWDQLVRFNEITLAFMNQIEGGSV